MVGKGLRSLVPSDRAHIALVCGVAVWVWLGLGGGSVSARASAGVSGGPGATAPTVLSALERMRDQGALSAERYYLYRVAAVRAPSRLPPALRGLPVGLGRAGAAGSAGPSATQVLVDAFQWVARNGAWGSDVHALLEPPPDDAYVISSSRRPVQVSYPDPGQRAYAEMVLSAAENAFDVEVDQWGFYPPNIEPGFEPYRMYIGETGQGVAGYTSPYDTNDTVGWASCYTYIVINPNLGDTAPTTVAHEFNHALQATMDCAEVTTYWENTSTYIESYVYPEYEAYQWAMMQYFQATPWKALDYFDNGGGYQYGGVLWNYYLAHRMAPEGDGPVLVREIWEACMQTGWDNEPDYQDAAEIVAGNRGLDATSIEALYTDFAEARYFVSSDDDGQHIERAGEFWHAELAPVARYDASVLPVRDVAPPPSEEPEPLGSNHIVVTVPSNWTRPIRVHLTLAQGTRWGARVVLAKEGRTTRSEEVPIDDQRGVGELTVQPEPGSTLLLVVANLGVEGYDPDQKRWPTSSYRYTIEPVVDPPVISGIYPGAVVRGQQGVRVRLTGSGFVYGDDFEVRFTDPQIEVAAVERVTDAEVIFQVIVPASTNLGLHGVTVVNAGGASATRARSFQVVDRLGPPSPAPGGGCRVAGGGSAPLPVPALVVLLWAGWWRRR